MKAICLISGGLDSSVTTFIANSQQYEIYGLTFNYGQKHNKEIKCAKKIGQSIPVKKHIIFDLNLKQFKGSSLINTEQKPELDDTINQIGKKIPSTYVPARNTIFIAIALAYAEVKDANAIFIGATATDYSGYPDCRPKYFRQYQQLIDIATKKTVEGKKIEIKTPLLNLSKAEIIRKGVKLKVPFENTWSCYLGEDKPCGKCHSCKLRLKGFKEAKMKDPLQYQ